MKMLKSVLDAKSNAVDDVFEQAAWLGDIVLDNAKRTDENAKAYDESVKVRKELRTAYIKRQKQDRKKYYTSGAIFGGLTALAGFTAAIFFDAYKKFKKK
jgi:hypothetical protein